MVDHAVTVHLPDEVYTQIHRIAEATAKSVEQVLLEQLKMVLGIVLPPLPPDEEAELAAFKFLSDDTLRSIAREQMSRPKQEQMQHLMDKNNFGTITDQEYAELSTLVEQGQRLTLRKAWAAGVLMERGYKITARDMALEDA